MTRSLGRCSVALALAAWATFGWAETGRTTASARPAPAALAGAQFLTAADLDGDGRAELIGADAGGRLAAAKAEGTTTAAASLAAGGLVAAGDVDGDGRVEVVVAAGSALDVLRADGKGGFEGVARIALPGTATALAVGEINRPDGVADIVVGVEGARLVVFQSIYGAAKAVPEVVELPADPWSIALGHLDAAYPADVAVATAKGVFVARGIDRAADPRATLRFAAAPGVDEARDVVFGRFARGAAVEPGLAALDGDGAVRILSYRDGRWTAETRLAGPRGLTRLAAAKITSALGDDVAAIDPDNRSIVVASATGSESLELRGTPTALVAAPLSGRGRADLAAAIAGGGAELLPQREPIPFVVDDASDDAATAADDANPGDGVCATAGGTCTLRAAIMETNKSAGPTSITFNLTTPSIALKQALPPLVQATTIDGGAARVELTPDASAAASFVGLDLSADATAGTTSAGSVIRSLVIDRMGSWGLRIATAGNSVENCYVGPTAAGAAPATKNNGGILITGAGATGNMIGGATADKRNLISGNSTAGIRIDAGASGNTIAGNYVGTNAAGTAYLVSSPGDGVQIQGGSTNNVIGGVAAAPGSAPGNVISGNGSYSGAYGINVKDAGTNGTLIQGNLVGPQASGTAGIGNGSVAHVMVQGGSGATTIGGATASARNVISGNGGYNSNYGVEINGSSDNLVYGNYLGVDATGAAQLKNGRSGVYLTNGAKNNKIGDLADAPGLPPGNVISGNGNGAPTSDTDYRGGVTIEGSSTTGNFVRGNIVGLDAAGTKSLPNAEAGVRILLGAGNTVGGADVRARNVLSGNGPGSGSQAADGVAVWGAANTVIQGNYCGVAPDGTKAIANAGAGIRVMTKSGYTFASGTTIGGQTATPGAAPGNVVSGNSGDGIALVGTSSSAQNVLNTVIKGNLVGLNAAGTAALKNNGSFGVRIDAAKGTQLGGGQALDRNVISGNNDGVRIYNADGVSVQGNYIGLAADGATAVPNNNSGVKISTGATNATVGGDAATPGAAPGNVISGNKCSGTYPNDAAVKVEYTSGPNTIAGNLLGADATGTTAVPNLGDGVDIVSSAAGTTVARNVISGNAKYGVEIAASGISSPTKIVGNWIGVAVDKTTALGNTLAGINVGAGGAGSLIGGTSGATPGACTGDCNVVANNGGAGVVVGGTYSNNAVAIRANSIYGNGGIGIDLKGDGVTPNGANPGSGANNLQNYPILTAAQFDGANLTVGGVINTSKNTAVTIDVFGNAQVDPTGYGEGQTYLGAATCTTDANGFCAFTTAPIAVAATNIAATATDAGGNTSEFSHYFVNPSGGVPASGDGMVLVTKGGDGKLGLSFGAACGATTYALYSGATSVPQQAPVWSGFVCDVKSGDAYDPTVAPGDVHYFVIVAQNGVTEGSYGTDSKGAERAPHGATLSGACVLPQSLSVGCP
ncbi:MAG: FG-GAP-like repeat-containing protein [Candidatus Polarisedimenticolia bacterium]